MKTGARVDFNTTEDIEGRFRGVDFPVELALPYRAVDFMACVDHLDEIVDVVRSNGIEVLSVSCESAHVCTRVQRLCSNNHTWMLCTRVRKSLLAVSLRNACAHVCKQRRCGDVVMVDTGETKERDGKWWGC
jgi:hypothetical protein